MSLSEQLSEVRKRTKRKLKKETPNPRIWLVGARKWKDKRSIKKVLSQFSYQTVDFVLLGTAPGLEQLALSTCRALKFNAMLLPPNVTRDGINAVYFRNAVMFDLLKPTHVIGFHDNTDVAERIDEKMDSQLKSTLQLLKLAKAKKIDWQLVTTKEKIHNHHT